MLNKRVLPAIALISIVSVLTFCSKTDDPSGPGTDDLPNDESDIELIDLTESTFDIGLEQIAKTHNGLTNLVFHPADPNIFFYTLVFDVNELFSYNIEKQEFQQAADISGSFSTRALVGLEFHPDFLNNGRAFFSLVKYVDGDSLVSVLAEIQAIPPYETTTQFDPASVKELMSWGQYNNADHNISKVKFGPDGFLYVAAGDGGCCKDTRNQAQDISSFRGKILRIDVDSDAGGKGYSIPTSNPFVGVEGAREEIWAYGFRNPYRFTFDTEGGMYIFDVGENDVEEMNYLAKGSNLINFGWNVFEGPICFSGNQDCNVKEEEINFPILQVSHFQSKAIIGGIVYQGSAIADMKGQLIYGGDFIAGKIWSSSLNSPSSISTVYDLTDKLAPSGMLKDKLVSVNADPNGEPLILSFTGEVYRIIPN